MELFDLHCDTLTVAYDRAVSLTSNTLALDWERGRMYRPWCQVFALFTRDTLRGDAAFERALQVWAWADREAERLSDRFCWLRRGDSLAEAVKRVPCVGIRSVESGAVLGGKIERLADLGRCGVRLFGVTWNGDNELAHGCFSQDRTGLTAFGRQVISSLAAQGMVADVSHLNEAGFWDVMELAGLPPVATHSLSAAVHPHPRNLTDEQFTALCRRGGLVGVNFCEQHLGEGGAEAFVRHVWHDWELGGETVTALGGDLDGTPLREEWHDVRVYGILAEELLRRNVSETQVRRLFYQNAADYFTRVWADG